VRKEGGERSAYLARLEKEGKKEPEFVIVYRRGRKGGEVLPREKRKSQVMHAE